MTNRTERMIDSAPLYYQHSQIYEIIQTAQADEYDNQEAKSLDLQKQLYITTATWGLKYWEGLLGIIVNEADSYEIRRSRVLSKWRGIGNFSAEQIKSVCEAFTNGDVAVTVNTAAYSVDIKFIGARGVPPNLDDLKATVANIVHAHLGTTYSFTYTTVQEIITAAVTVGAITTAGITVEGLTTHQF